MAFVWTGMRHTNVRYKTGTRGGASIVSSKQFIETKVIVRTPIGVHRGIKYDDFIDRG